jgi:hypothetical protein
MPLGIFSLSKLCPVAAWAITFKNDGAFYHPLLGYLYPHKIFRLFYELPVIWHVIKLQGFSAEGMLKLVVVDILSTEHMLVLVADGNTKSVSVCSSGPI